MSLAPLEMSVPAGDGLVLKGTLSYPTGAAGQGFPLAVLAHQYPATRDSWSPLVARSAGAGVATLAFDLRGHGASIVSPKGPLVIDTPEGVTLEAFGAAFVSSAGKVGFSRITTTFSGSSAGACSRTSSTARRLLLLGASVGGSGVLLAAPDIPGVRGRRHAGRGAARRRSPTTAPARIRAAVERLRRRFTSRPPGTTRSTAPGTSAAWSQGLAPARTRIVPGAGHAMAIYFDVRDELLEFLRTALAPAMTLRPLGPDAGSVPAVGYGGMHLSIQDRPPEAERSAGAPRRAGRRRDADRHRRRLLPRRTGCRATTSG